MRDLIAIVEAAGSLPPSFVKALSRLAKVFSKTPGIIVGGAAVTFYTGGRILSGDFDFVIHGDNATFAEAMRSEGFLLEDRPGHLHIGWYSPDLPSYGFQVVSGPLFDGRADPSKIRRCRFGGRPVMFAPPEDLIADRLAQYAIGSPTDHSRLDQAKLIFKLVPDLDKPYMVRRIEQEGGDPDLLGDRE